jgi:hypothetical protein
MAKITHLRWKLFRAWLGNGKTQETIYVCSSIIVTLAACYYGLYCLRAKAYLFGPPAINVAFFVVVFGHFAFIVLYVLWAWLTGRLGRK